MAGHLRDRDKEREQHLHTEAGQSNTTREHIVEGLGIKQSFHVWSTIISVRIVQIAILMVIYSVTTKSLNDHENVFDSVNGFNALLADLVRTPDFR